MTAAGAATVNDNAAAAVTTRETRKGLPRVSFIFASEDKEVDGPAKRAATVRQVAWQLQRSLDSRRHVARTATPIALNAVANSKKNGCSENSVAGVEECVLLELLITCRGLAMAFSGIYDPSTGNALRPGRKAEDPTKAHNGRDYYSHHHKTHPNRPL